LIPITNKLYELYIHNVVNYNIIRRSQIKPIKPQYSSSLIMYPFHCQTPNNRH
jgi:hypothetical protein